MDRRVLLMLDWAGWHIGKVAEISEGIGLGLLLTRPSCSLRSVCGPWSKRGQPNRPFEDVDELGEALVERYLTLSEEHELARSHTRFLWWPDAA
jgi:hypothetical protein